jgi:branched-chain amino acid transport system ATP-binding protein
LYRRKPHEILKAGFARTFQNIRLFHNMTAQENVMVGCFLRTRSRAAAEKKAQGLLEQLNLTAVARERVANLPVAAQKRVVMAAALATDPQMLLLDEVAGGLNPTEIEQMIGVIRWVHNDLKVTVFLIEHVMELVMKLSHRVLVLDSGRLIAEGPPEDIVRRPEVIKAYLGERYVAEHGA